MPGDRVDGDRDIATGCECVIQSLDDPPGPPLASGPNLDTNCDGADGVVVQSIYVAPDGSDDWPGSPTRPMRTIQAALRRAEESLGTSSPRPHVFVASGAYAETITVPDGVTIHGGYRRDFLFLDPQGFRVEVRAPSTSSAPGGAALIVRGAGHRETIVEWLFLRGLDASELEAPAFGILLVDPGPQLVIRANQIRSGNAGPGRAGRDGAAGADPMLPPMPGEAPRAAIENPMRVCISGEINRVRGGAGGKNVCDGIDVSGGDGGSAGCPRFGAFQGGGDRGRGTPASPGGEGGSGGQDSEG
ncbi:MAG: DUF1565 domain-containing protein, partial [Deltaproteobacteria bacterium]|nr:DUF1565 domain-containing protein [Deltaproteobacteria bacterium]